MQHLVPPVILKIHIDVRHLLALHIQEPLKDQPVLQRVHIGNAQAVEGHAGRRAPPHRRHYPPPPHKIHYVPHHQEVVGELGIADDLQLVLQPLLRLRGRLGIAASKPFPADLRQIFVGVQIVRRRILGQVRQTKAQLHIAQLRNALRVGQGLRVVGKKPRHFLRAFDVVGIILHPQPLFILHRGVGLDADVDVLQGGIGLVDVVGVISCHQRDAQFLAEGGQPGVDGRQLLHMVVPLQLQEIVFPEQFPIPADALPGVIHTARGNQARHFRRGAPGKADKPLVILFQQFVVNAGAVVKAFQMPLGHQLHQVAVPGIVPGQQYQMIGAAFRAAAVVAAVVRHIDLAADNGLDTHFLALGIKVHHAVQVAVVGNGKGVHPQTFDLSHQFGDAADAVQHTVFGVGMEMGEQE